MIDSEVMNVVAIVCGTVASVGLLVILVAGFRAFPAEPKPQPEPTQTQIRVAKFAAAYFGPRGERYDADGVLR